MRGSSTTKSIQPLTPRQAIQRHSKSIPDGVINVFNEMLTEEISPNGAYAILYQDRVLRRLEKAGFNRQEVLDRGWLDIERIFQEAGWDVQYDSPAYNERGHAYFRFKSLQKN